MKLRNKKTGKIIDLEFWGIFTDGDAIGFESEYEDENEYCYNSLAELNEEWEDYTPQEPLIKDDKIRKAVRAWAEAESISSEKTVFYNDGEYSIGWYRSELEFSKPIQGLTAGDYTITELCGEEEC